MFWSPAKPESCSPPRLISPFWSAAFSPPSGRPRLPSIFLPRLGSPTTFSSAPSAATPSPCLSLPAKSTASVSLLPSFHTSWAATPSGASASFTPWGTNLSQALVICCTTCGAASLMPSKFLAAACQSPFLSASSAPVIAGSAAPASATSVPMVPSFSFTSAGTILSSCLSRNATVCGAACFTASMPAAAAFQSPFLIASTVSIAEGSAEPSSVAVVPSWPSFFFTSAGSALSSLSVMSAPRATAFITDKLDKALPADVKKKLGQLGTTATELGSALPSAIDTVDAIKKGDWKAAAAGIGAVKQAAPQTVAFLDKQLDKIVPADVKEKLGTIGTDVAEAGAALPAITGALDALKKGDWQAAAKNFDGIKDAAPHVVQQITNAWDKFVPQGVKDALAPLGVAAQDVWKLGSKLTDAVDFAGKLKQGDGVAAL